MSLHASILVAAVLLAGPVAPATAPPARAPGPWDVIWDVEPPDGAPTAPRPTVNAKLRAEGSKLYQSRCVACHGSKGDGAGAWAAKLSPRPTDFTRGVFKVRSTPPGSLPTDEDLFRTLTRGLHGTSMEPWRRLSERERWALVTQIESFSPRFRQEPPPRAIAVPIAPRELKDLRNAGELAYMRMGCGMCHGDSGQGDGPARAAFKRDPTRKVEIRNFTRGRFIRGAEMEDLYLTLKVGIEGTPMMAYKELSDAEIWALAAYVRLLVRERPLRDFPPAWQAEDDDAPAK